MNPDTTAADDTRPSQTDASSTNAKPPARYHGLDALRGFAMMLGIVLHAALAYFAGDADADYGAFWPQDDQQSPLSWVVFTFIHSWRMPTFFLLAGFFAHLVLDRRGDGYFVRDRLNRILLPLIVFGLIMAAIIPSIWVSAFARELTLVTPLEIPPSIGHLWFIYHLVYLYVILVAARWIASKKPRPLQLGRMLLAIFVNRRAARWVARRILRTLPLGRILLAVFVNRWHVPLIILFSVITLARFIENVEDYLLWPIGAWDFMYSLVPFLIGYGLYKRREIVDSLASTSSTVSLLSVATVAFAVQLVLTVVTSADDAAAEQWGLLLILTQSTATVCYTFGLIGLFQLAFSTHSSWVRWVADSSYWVYIMHLPVVLVIGTLMFELPWPADLKFIIVCVVTGALGFATYWAFIRYTFIGTMLNGKRIRGHVGRPPPSHPPQPAAASPVT